MIARLFAAPFLIVTLATHPAGAQSRPPAAQGSTPLVHYRLLDDLNDATGVHAPLQTTNAPIHQGRGIFCNGLYVLEGPNGCDVHTPMLNDLDVSAFTISVEFLALRGGGAPFRPVFVAGRNRRWLFYRLEPGGVIQLGYNNSQFAACSVKYRIGFWHEATITFDGRTATLYLDGAAGCRASVSLNVDGDKVVMLTNFSDATTFHGMVRQLRIFNGVVVPPRRTAEADTFPTPAPPNLSAADLFLAKCPTAEDVASVEADLRLSFESDPTSDEPIACPAVDSLLPLSPLKKRVYNTLLLMRRLQFAQPLPWTKEPLYQWLIGSIRGIRFRADIRYSSCCDPRGVINVQTGGASTIAFTDRWIEPAIHGGLSGFMLLIVHESRHAEGYPHTCGTNDRTVEEMGGWGVAYSLARWLAEQTDQAFFSSGEVRYNEQLIKNSDMLRRTSFCQP